jgi:periplasmic divalent cation tolerance protein
MDAILLVITTLPDIESAEKMALLLLNQSRAACVSMVPGVRSYYRWQGQIETSHEVMLYIKIAAGKYAALEQLIRQQHPYELPEIIATRLDAALPAYQAWVLAAGEPT